MKRNYSCLLFMLAFFLCFSVQSQTWQWAKRGGGTDNIPEYTYNVKEQVRDMDTDASGNVFILSPIGLTNVDVDGVDKETYGEYTGAGGALNDYLVSSFDCQGILRWSKVLSGFASDYFHTIGTDASGNVYLTGQMYPSSGPSQETIHFDTDSIVPYQSGNVNKQSLFLIKYTNEGSMEWVRAPQPDDVSIMVSLTALSYAMDLDEQGNAYWLCGLPQGSYAQGQYVNTVEGITTHLLKYDANGNFVEGHPFDIALSGGAHYNIKMVRNASTDKFYIAGYRYPITTMQVSMGGEPITKPMYLAAFSSAGALEWKVENTESTNAAYYGYLCDIDLDAEGNIYITGRTKSTDTFAGGTFASGTTYAFPFVMKISAGGNTIWSTNAVSNSSVFSASIVVNGNEVAITGGGGLLQWQGQSTDFAGNQGYDTFFARFTTSDGTLISLEQITGSWGYDDYGTALAVTPSGNYYVGGSFGNQISPGDTTIISNGGQSDFFVARYGSEACDCAPPVASFSFVADEQDGLTYNFTYTGDDYDIISWDFGNGTTSLNENPNYTYAAAGEYPVCVTATNACGSNEYCLNIEIALGMQNFNANALTIYPNPAGNSITVTADSYIHYIIYNAIGQQVIAGSLAAGNNVLNVAALSQGVYSIHFQDSAAKSRVLKFLKE
jgi:PKD domain/Secretion system C-terminal sorting domain